jgi:uncharacterized membrane protein (UPF0182 family)
MRRVWSAISLRDINILISGNVTPESRLHLNRNILECPKADAFLYFDEDPYCVVIEGRIYWFLDAYTVSDRFPYSTPAGENGTGRITSAIRSKS